MNKYQPTMRIVKTFIKIHLSALRFMFWIKYPVFPDKLSRLQSMCNMSLLRLLTLLKMEKQATITVKGKTVSICHQFSPNPDRIPIVLNDNYRK
ncbi:MAG: hypothetical protein Q8909_02170 [Bacteroidota bacterium]|nr:hypothetical protein [Bacteroidota bacterium]